MSHWLKAAAGGLLFLASALAASAPSQAFEQYMTRPVWAPPPNMSQIDLDYGYGNDRNWSVFADTLKTAPDASGYGPRRGVTAFVRQVVLYDTAQPAGTIVVDTGHKFLYLVLGRGRAMRYGVGTARDGFAWQGSYRISNKREWPGWTPPAEMLERQPGIPHHMIGGINNPLGARALYIGSTLYRIHGTNQPWTIGTDISSGCIRMTNDDVIDLYSRAQIGAKVIVL